jgi:hypothetical protein
MLKNSTALTNTSTEYTPEVTIPRLNLSVIKITTSIFHQYVRNNLRKPGFILVLVLQILISLGSLILYFPDFSSPAISFQTSLADSNTGVLKEKSKDCLHFPSYHFSLGNLTLHPGYNP